MSASIHQFEILQFEILQYSDPARQIRSIRSPDNTKMTPTRMAIALSPRALEMMVLLLRSVLILLTDGRWDVPTLLHEGIVDMIVTVENVPSTRAKSARSQLLILVIG